MVAAEAGAPKADQVARPPARAISMVRSIIHDIGKAASPKSLRADSIPRHARTRNPRSSGIGPGPARADPECGIRISRWARLLLQAGSGLDSISEDHAIRSTSPLQRARHGLRKDVTKLVSNIRYRVAAQGGGQRIPDDHQRNQQEVRIVGTQGNAGESAFRSDRRSISTTTPADRPASLGSRHDLKTKPELRAS